MSRKRDQLGRALWRQAGLSIIDPKEQVFYELDSLRADNELFRLTKMAQSIIPKVCQGIPCPITSAVFLELELCFPSCQQDFFDKCEDCKKGYNDIILLIKGHQIKQAKQQFFQLKNKFDKKCNQTTIDEKLLAKKLFDKNFCNSLAALGSVGLSLEAEVDNSPTWVPRKKINCILMGLLSTLESILEHLTAKVAV